MAPRVSVLLPTWNRVAWMKQAAESILAQDVDLELVILDNGCRDNTWQVLQELAAKDPRVRPLRFEQNDGVEMYYFLAGEARGDYVVFFADDDEMLPGTLGRKVRILDENPGIGLVYSTVRQMDAEGRDLGESRMGCRFQEDLIGGAADFETLILGDYMPMPSVLFRREFLKHRGVLHDMSYAPATDWQFWLAVIRETDAAFIREPNVRLRIHSQQETQTFGLSQRRLLDAHLRVWRHWMLEADPVYIPTAAAWNHICQEQIQVVQASVCGEEEVQAEMARLDDLLREQKLLLSRSLAGGGEIRSAAFLYDADWKGVEWVEVLMSYLDAFAPGDPVALVLFLDPKVLPLAQVEQMVVNVVMKAGLERFPDVILMDDPSELPATLRPFQLTQWVPEGRGNGEGLVGPFGLRLAQARRRLTSPRPASPANQSAV